MNEERHFMTAAVHFSIKYDGPALASHQMDVRELAPALIALSELLESSNRAAFPNSPEVRVNVSGSFKSGSFGVDLIAIQNSAQQIVAMFSGQNASAAANLLGILTGLGFLGSGGLIGVIKWLRGRKPSTIKFDGDKTVFEIQNNETIESFSVDLVAGKLYQNRIVRQSLAKVIAPLKREGVDIFASGQNGETGTVVEKGEVAYFDQAASESDIVSDTLSKGVLLQIELAVFKEDNKWRFTDGATTFFAEIADKDFVARINSGDERFGKGDVLVVDLRRIQSVTDNGLKQEYSIDQVIEHREPKM